MMWRILAILIVLDQITKLLVPRDFLIANYGLPFGIDLGNWNAVALVVAGVMLLGFYFSGLTHRPILRTEIQGFWPIAALFCCGFTRRSSTTSRKILTKCLALGQMRKSCFFYRQDIARIPKISFALIFAGAISNLLDRIMLGFVRDYLDLRVVTINLADIFIVGGLFVLLFSHDQKSQNIGH